MAIFKKYDDWYIDYYFDGKRLREKVGTSFELAKQVLNKRKTEIAEKKFFPERAAGTITFKALLDKYWDLHGQFLKSQSWSSYRTELEDSLGESKIDSITTADIQKYYNTVRKRASISSANRHFNLIRAVFNQAIAWGDYYKANPCKAVKRGKDPKHRLRYLSQEEMKDLLIHCSPRFYPVVMCALLTGMRKGEILGLDWANVSLERGIIYLLETKSDEAREIPISGKLHEVFKTLPNQANSVFGMTSQMVRKDFAFALTGAKIDPAGFKFHDLRHTFASWFMIRGGNLYTLQKLLGHSSPSMTQRYAHLSLGRLTKEMSTFQRAIPNGHPKDTMPKLYYSHTQNSV